MLLCLKERSVFLIWTRQSSLAFSTEREKPSWRSWKIYFMQFNEMIAALFTRIKMRHQTKDQRWKFKWALFRWLKKKNQVRCTSEAEQFVILVILSCLWYLIIRLLGYSHQLWCEVEIMEWKMISCKNNLPRLNFIFNTWLRALIYFIGDDWVSWNVDTAYQYPDEDEFLYMSVVLVMSRINLDIWVCFTAFFHKILNFALKKVLFGLCLM